MGLAVVDLSADFRLVDAAIYERWYAPARRARAARERRLRAHRARPRPDPDRRAGRQPRLLSDRGAARARAARRARAGALGGDRREVGRLRGRPRRRRAGRARQPDREPDARTRSTATATCPRSSRSWSGSPGDAVDVTFVPHLLPIDQGLLASCYVELAEPLEDRSSSCTRSATTASRSSRWSQAPPGVRDVRDTNLCRIHATTAGRGPCGRLRRDRQPLEGRRRPGDPEPQPDARLDERDGLCDDASSARAGWPRRPGSRSSTRPDWRRASAPPGSPAG